MDRHRRYMGNPRRKGLHAQSERAAAQRARRYADQRCQGRKEGAQIAPLHRPYGDGPRFAISARIIARSDCADARRSEEHTSELQSIMRISYAVFCLTKKKK